MASLLRSQGSCVDAFRFRVDPQIERAINNLIAVSIRHQTLRTEVATKSG